MEGFSVLQYAIAYVERGWSVIPLQPKGKRPLLDWTEYSKRRPTQDELQEWFTDPDVNIGIPCGSVSSLYVIDIDPRHGGNESLAELNLGRPTVITGGSGYHYYYRYRDGLRNFAGRWPGIDGRGTGGYVVAPPSVHESGQRYQWVSRQIPTELEEIPECLRDQVVKPSLNVQRQKSVSCFGRLGTYQRSLDPATAGSRNCAAAKLTGSLLWNGIPIERIWEILRLWNSENSPPLDETELRAVLDSMRQTHERNSKMDKVNP